MSLDWQAQPDPDSDNGTQQAPHVPDVRTPSIWEDIRSVTPFVLIGAMVWGIIANERRAQTDAHILKRLDETDKRIDAIKANRVERPGN